jgi:hypothetical protein
MIPKGRRRTNKMTNITKKQIKKKIEKIKEIEL